MITILKGVGLLLLTLAVFSVFSMKAPKGSDAMSGMANAASASFLVEAVHKYILGDVLALEFFQILGATSGDMGGVAAAITVPLAMGVNPVFAVTAGLALGGYGILPGFIAGYIVGLIAPVLEKKLPEGLNVIFGALVIAPLARILAITVNPAVNMILGEIGSAISAAAEQSPLVMGFLLGGIMKMICTSPPELHGSDRYAGSDRPAHGHCRYRLCRRFLHQRHYLPQAGFWQQGQRHCCHAGAPDSGKHHHCQPHSHLLFQLPGRWSGRCCCSCLWNCQQRSRHRISYPRSAGTLCF